MFRLCRRQSGNTADFGEVKSNCKSFSRRRDFRMTGLYGRHMWRDGSGCNWVMVSPASSYVRAWTPIRQPGWSPALPSSALFSGRGQQNF
jgi:hypothetical protein